MTKIFTGFLAVLLFLFPFSSTLRAAYQNQLYLGKDAITANIIYAIESKDVDALEEMFSDGKKESVEKLENKLQDLVELIDGDIINAGFLVGAHDSDESSMGYKKSIRSWFIEIETTNDTYFLLVGWTKIDTSKPKNVGMTTLGLQDSKGHNGTHDYLILIE